MKMHQVAASVLCMALLLALCLSVACSEEIMPFAESGNSVRAVLSFSGGKVIGESRVKKLEVGCTASTTVYVQAKSGSGWTTKASGSGGREASASCTCLLYTSGHQITAFQALGQRKSADGFSANAGLVLSLIHISPGWIPRCCRPSCQSGS